MPQNEFIQNYKGLVQYSYLVPSIDEKDTEFQMKLAYFWEVPDGTTPDRRDIQERFASWDRPMTATYVYLCYN